jgi:hypothetical protein
MGWKNVENRDWRKPNPGLNFRGRVAIHASSGMTQDEYRSAAQTFEDAGHVLPLPAELKRGAIIGEATVVNVANQHEEPSLLGNPWFFGPRALVLTDAIAYAEPIPCDGALGFFKWNYAGRGMLEPKPWMVKAPYLSSVQRERPWGTLL